MNKENISQEKDEIVIDISVLWNVFRSHFVSITLCGILTAVIVFALSQYVIPKKYTSEVLFYVENNTNQSDTLNYNDITAAQKLVNTCEVIFTSEYTMSLVEEKLGEDFGFKPEMVSISAVNNTEVLSISVESESAEKSVKIGEAFAEIAPQEFLRVVKSGAIEMIADASYPKEFSFPNVTLFTVGGFAIGFAVLYVIFLIKTITDVKVKPDDDLSGRYDIPVFAEIMDYDSMTRGSKYE